MDITDIPGVGESVAAAMKEQGLGTLREVARASIDELTAVPGIGAVSAKRIRKEAKKLITPQVSVGMAPPEPEPEKKKEAKAKKKDDAKDDKKKSDDVPKVMKVQVRPAKRGKKQKKDRGGKKKLSRKAKKALGRAKRLEEKAAKLAKRMGKQLAKAAKVRKKGGLPSD